MYKGNFTIWLWEILPFSFGFKETLRKLCKGNFVFCFNTQEVIPTLVWFPDLWAGLVDLCRQTRYCI